MNVVIISGMALPTVSVSDIERVREAAGPGSEVAVVDSEGEALELAAEADVIMGFVSPRLFAAAPKLRWVHAIASGVDRYLYPEFREGEVVLTSEKGQVGGQLAEHAFALLLALTRRVAAAIRLARTPGATGASCGWRRPSSRAGRWASSASGGTGRAVARRAAAFGMRCLAVDRDAVAGSEEVEAAWPLERFDELLAASDVVAICCPLTPETRGLFGHKAFERMKSSAYLVNVTRGEIVDGDALVEALDAGALAGAALDVAPIEPLPPDHPLWRRDNVVMTPHTAGASQLRVRRNLDRFCRNLVRFRNGEPLEGVIDKEAGY